MSSSYPRSRYQAGLNLLLQGQSAKVPELIAQPTDDAERWLVILAHSASGQWGEVLTLQGQTIGNLPPPDLLGAIQEHFRHTGEAQLLSLIHI